MTKILVVDDEEHIRLLYSEELKTEGYEVATAASGHKFLERIEQEKPNLIILDIEMPDCNGLELLNILRSKHFDLPVVLCSAHNDYRGDVKTISAAYYVIKSFDLTELKDKIASALKK
ncbi:MAG: response regulator [Pseudomonadota bacterium]